jgi:hypothetical protein
VAPCSSKAQREKDKVGFAPSIYAAGFPKFLDGFKAK